MRRLLLFAASLVLLGLTSATAATFDVQSEDIASFRSDVSIPIPETTYYLVGRYGLATRLDEAQYTEGIAAPNWLEWESEAIDAGLPVAGAVITLNVYTTGGTDTALATIYECPDVDGTPTVDCTPLAQSTNESVSNGVNTLELSPLPTLTDQIRPGFRLRLRITAVSGSFNVQWGKDDPLRDSRLVFVSQ